MPKYKSPNNKIGFHKEPIFRCGKTTGSQTTPVPLSATEVLAFDRINEDKFTLPIPALKSEKIHTAGDGRNGSNRIYTGYDMVEKDIPMDMQTAIFLMYVQGTCSTQGTGLSPYTYFHYITEANTLYSLIFHDEKFNDSSPFAGDNTYDLFREYYGVLVKKVTIKITRGEKVTCTATCMVGKYGETRTSGSADATLANSLAVNKQTTFPSPLSSAIADFYTYDMIDQTNSYFRYNSVAIDSQFWNQTESIEITIENVDLKVEQSLGDKFPYNVVIGPREYTIKITGYSPMNNTVYSLNNRKLTEYAGVIDFRIRLSRDKTNSTNYLQLTFDNLYLKPFEEPVVNQKEAEHKIDLELENGTPFTDTNAVAHAVGTCSTTALDKLNQYYYESTSDLA